ncbi:MAG: Fe(2+)-trafficking protein [Phycisphaeraceae bacterium]
MATLEERIAQWEQMAREAPDDMAYFSLGSAYREAERYEDAEQAFAKALELNPGMSRAYQLRGQVLIKLGREDEAAALLSEGYKTAAERGDVMPQRAMGSLLEKLGQPLPEVQSAEERKAEVESEDTVLDRRTGEPQQRLPDPPMRGPLGRFIYDHFGQETWRTWIGQGTKVINELRLDFSNPQHQDTYEQYMLEWLQVTREEVDAYAKQIEEQGQ